IAITTSGKSPNVIRAIETAKEMGIYTIGLLGKGGGKAKELVDLAIVVPSDDTARIQESHITIGHIIAEIIEEDEV
ncbi:phosphoheptose isomerase, partial [bacterium]